MGNLRQLRRSVTESFRDASEDERTRYEIVVSASSFSRRAREMVDDKLSFTAALMRAGEVDAANRLLREVERDVREEEATLFERVNEARAAASVRRQAMTRLRLVRVLATAMVGATLVAFSAVGMAVVSWLDDRNESEYSRSAVEIEATRVVTQGFQPSLTQLKIAGVRLDLDGPQMRRFKKLTSDAVDPAELQHFLLGLLPPELADRVHKALVATSPVTASSPAAAEIEAAVAETGRKAAKKAKDAQQSQPKPGTSSESDEGEGSSGGGNGNGGGGGNGDDEDDDRDESENPLPGLP